MLNFEDFEDFRRFLKTLENLCIVSTHIQHEGVMKQEPELLPAFAVRCDILPLVADP